MATIACDGRVVPGSLGSSFPPAKWGARNLDLSRGRSNINNSRDHWEGWRRRGGRPGSRARREGRGLARGSRVRERTRGRGSRASPGAPCRARRRRARDGVGAPSVGESGRWIFACPFATFLNGPRRRRGAGQDGDSASGGCFSPLPPRFDSSSRCRVLHDTTRRGRERLPIPSVGDLARNRLGAPGRLLLARKMGRGRKENEI